MPAELIRVIGSYGQLIIDNQPNVLSAILIVAETCIQKLGRRPPRLSSTKEESKSLPIDSFTDACIILEISEKDIPKIHEGIQETLRSEN